MKIAVKRDGWFRPRGYPHLDRPLPFEIAKALATDPARVIAHEFLPLLGYTDTKRQLRTDNSDRSVPKSKRPRVIKKKSREIRYAAHADAAIYSYYAAKLQQAYESCLQQCELQDAVIGYRSGKGSNVDMAAEAFAEIAERETATALCFDISDFFPSINHEQLKACLSEVLGVDIYPPIGTGYIGHALSLVG